MAVPTVSAGAASGRFLLRLPVELHARLQADARAHDLSLNEYCVRRLGVPGPTRLADDGARAAVTRAWTVLGDGLYGVVLYGSLARGEAASQSDVDLLIVADETVQLTRDLYRRWDDAPVTWGGRTVDPHFVRLPRKRRVALGAWCEAAIDGVVLFERNGAVSRHLAAVRSDIAAGRIVRRSAHGQPYWAVAA